MAVPFSLKVEIGFQQDPYAASITWTDVTAYVIEGDTKRGKQDDLGENEPGVLNLTLDNSDGRFDPLNASSPYYPYVLPYRPIRVTGTYNSVTYGMHYGYIERWPQTWTLNGALSEVHITSVDGFKAVFSKQFGQRYKDYAKATGTSRKYFPLDSTLSPSGQLGNLTSSDTTNDSVAAPSGSVSAGLSIANVTTVIGSGSNSVQHRFDPSLPDDINASATGVQSWETTTGPYREFFFRLDQPDTNATHSTVFLLSAVTSASKTHGIAMRHSATTSSGYELWWAMRDESASTYTWTYNAKIADVALGQTYLISVMRYTSPSQTFDVWVNGVSAVTGMVITGSNHLTAFGKFFPYNGPAVGTPVPLPRGLRFSIGHLWSDTAAPVMSDHMFKAGVSNSSGLKYVDFPQQVTGMRIASCLDTIGWPSSLRSIDAGLTTIQAANNLEGKTVLSVLNAAANAELGNVFIDGSGRFVFHDRQHRYASTSAVTFGDDAGEFPYDNGVTVEFDDQSVVNEYTLNIDNDLLSDTFAADATSQATYGVRAESLSMPLVNQSDATNVPKALLMRNKDPHARVASVTLDAATETNLPHMLGREIGDKATFKRRPDSGNVITINTVIEGVSHRFDKDSLSTTFLLSPDYTGAWVLGDPVNGVLSTTTVLAY